MKCPDGHGDLIETTRDGVHVELCPTCNGMWFSAQELNQLEDESFHLGDNEKGSLVFSATATTRACPVCDTAMKRFAYRLYDLELEFCDAGHGYWLDAGEDRRVLELMKEEAARLKRSTRAEHHWASLLQHLRSGSFLDKARDLFR